MTYSYARKKAQASIEVQFGMLNDLKDRGGVKTFCIFFWWRFLYAPYAVFNSDLLLMKFTYEQYTKCICF